MPKKKLNINKMKQSQISEEIKKVNFIKKKQTDWKKLQSCCSKKFKAYKKIMYFCKSKINKFVMLKTQLNKF